MRCARCGNENPSDNRFCGMCGSTLLSPPPIAETATQRAASAVTSVPVPTTVAPPVIPPAVRPVEPPRAPIRTSVTPAPEREEAPVISGPSFLGLNQPAPRKRGDLSINPQGGSSSRSLDYLLDDEEPESGGGAGKFVVVLVLLALVAGFGYMTWRHAGVGWLTSLLSKPPATAQAPSETDGGTPTSGAAPETQTPAASQPAPASVQTPANAPVDNSATPAHPASAPSGTAPATTPSATDNSKTEKAANPEENSDDDASADDKAPAPTPVTTPAPTPKLEKPRAAVEKPALKPRATVAPERSVDSVSEAQKYIYGRGAPQDCDRGLRLLKPAANAANPKAMIEMGALYSAGLCTPRDLPTAYRWFALALRKDPDNLPVQKDLQKLWGEMTQPERQLAIKLTQ